MDGWMCLVAINEIILQEVLCIPVVQACPSLPEGQQDVIMMLSKRAEKSNILI